MAKFSASRRSSLRVSPNGASFEWLLGAVEAHHRALEAGERVLKNEHKTDITRVEWQRTRAVVKHYRYMGARFLLKGLFRTHPGRRSLKGAMALAERSIPTPTVLGLVERTVLGLTIESWLLTEEISGAVEMDRYILRTFGDECDFRRRRRFVLAFAEALQKLMGSGVLHRDLKTCNILVIEQGDSWQFAFIDLDDTRVFPAPGAVERKDWVLALAQINPSTPKLLPWTDRLRFFNQLRELKAYDRREFIAEVQEISRRRGRAYFSDEGPVEIEFA